MKFFDLFCYWNRKTTSRLHSGRKLWEFMLISVFVMTEHCLEEGKRDKRPKGWLEWKMKPVIKLGWNELSRPYCFMRTFRTFPSQILHLHLHTGTWKAGTTKAIFDIRGNGSDGNLSVNTERASSFRSLRRFCFPSEVILKYIATFSELVGVPEQIVVNCYHLPEREAQVNRNSIIVDGHEVHRTIFALVLSSPSIQLKFNFRTLSARRDMIGKCSLIIHNVARIEGGNKRVFMAPWRTFKFLMKSIVVEL